jgi:hypothetical protein
MRPGGSRYTNSIASGNTEVRAVVVCRVLVVGSVCDVRAMQGAADGRRAQQQDLGSAYKAVEATDRAARWVVVGGMDGQSFGE